MWVIVCVAVCCTCQVADTVSIYAARSVIVMQGCVKAVLAPLGERKKIFSRGVTRQARLAPLIQSLYKFVAQALWYVAQCSVGNLAVFN
jgi:hypothetical protein